MKLLPRRRSNRPPEDTCLWCRQSIDGAVYIVPGPRWYRLDRLHDDRPDCRLAARMLMLTRHGMIGYLAERGWSQGSVTGQWFSPFNSAVENEPLFGPLAVVARFEGRGREDVLYDMLAWQMLDDLRQAPE